MAGMAQVTRECLHMDTHKMAIWIEQLMTNDGILVYPIVRQIHISLYGGFLK